MVWSALLRLDSTKVVDITKDRKRGLTGEALHLAMKITLASNSLCIRIRQKRN